MDPLTLLIRATLAEVGVRDEPRVHQVQVRAMQALRQHYAGDTIRYYVPKHATDFRAQRAREVRAMFSAGTGVEAIGHQVGLSPRQIARIVRGK